MMDDEGFEGTDLPKGWRPGDRLYGAKVKPEKFKCGGWTGCDEDHDFFPPEDVLVLNEAIPLDEFRTHHDIWTQEREDKAVTNKTLYVGKIAVIPTMLGMWFEEASVN